MSMIISHSSALERLRAIPPSFDNCTVIGGPTMLPKVPSFSKQDILDMRRLGVHQLPINVLVRRQNKQGDGVFVKTHMQSIDQMPGGLLRLIEPDIFVSGPELVFLQMASQLSFVGLVVLGFELCGTYSHFAPKVSGFYKRSPLAEKKDIEKALGLFKGFHGCKNARQALPYVLEGSASPMETVLACLLTFPADMGGEGYAQPVPNLMVPLSPAGTRITKTDYCKVDLAWPEAKIGFEYNGGPYHTDEEQDRLRREALAHEKWTIYTADIDRLAKYSAFEALVGLLESEIPRTSKGARPEKSESKRLFGRLMKATRAGMGMNDAVFGAPIPQGAVEIHFSS